MYGQYACYYCLQMVLNDTSIALLFTVLKVSLALDTYTKLFLFCFCFFNMHVCSLSSHTHTNTTFVQYCFRNRFSCLCKIIYIISTSLRVATLLESELYKTIKFGD
jgi:hypothetical protein